MTDTSKERVGEWVQHLRAKDEDGDLTLGEEGLLLAGVLEALTERAEKAEAEARDVRAAVHALERGHEADLARMQKEIEGWQAERNVARQDQEAAQARVAALGGALRQADCPHSIQGDDGTVGDCVAKGHCGCCLGEPLKVAALSAPPTPAVVHASDCAVHNAPALPPGPCNCGADHAVSQAAADVLAECWTVTAGDEVRGSTASASKEAADRVRAELERLDRLDRATQAEG